MGLGLSNQVAISRRGGNNLAGVENGHNTGPRHKRTKRLLRAPKSSLHEMTVYFILFYNYYYFLIRDILCQWTLVIIRKHNIK